MTRISCATSKYILLSSMGMVFSEACVLHGVIDFKLFYLLMAVNIVPLMTAWRLQVPLGYIGTMLFVCAMGLLAIARGTDTISAFAQQIVGIGCCSFYFYLVFATTQYSLAKICQVYTCFAYWLTVLGLLLSAGITVVTGTFEPVRSIMLEPAHFATIVTPALYYSASQAIRHRRQSQRALVLLLGVLLSGSSTGYFGLLFCAALLLRRKPVVAIVASTLLIGTGWGMYTINDHFRIRIDDTVSGASDFDLAGLNLSSFAFLSNVYVTKRAFQERPLSGYGLGAHQLAHDQFMGELPDLRNLEQYADIDRRDANSLLLRIVSEFGLIGVCMLIIFIRKYYVKASVEYGEMSAAMLTYFFPKLLREGHWFSPEMYFFVWFYVFAAQMPKHAQFVNRYSNDMITSYGKAGTVPERA